MTEAQATATMFDAQRIRITTPRSFDDVLTQLRQLIGTATIEQYPAAMQQLGGINQENFEAVVRSQLGPSEFMLFRDGLPAASVVGWRSSRLPPYHVARPGVLPDPPRSALSAACTDVPRGEAYWHQY